MSPEFPTVKHLGNVEEVGRQDAKDAKKGENKSDNRKGAKAQRKAAKNF